MPISDTSGQDVALAPASRKPLWIGLGVAAVALTALLAWGAPQLLRWSQAEAAVPRERLRFAEVHYGDLVRDVSVQGRVVAAVSPTLFASSDGTITLLVESGAGVSEGDTVAVVDSPELDNRLRQEEATLESQVVELERQRIQTRQQLLESQKAVDLAQVALTAADREKRRADLSFERSIIPEIDLEKAVDELESAELAQVHAIEDLALERERLSFELRTRELQVERQQLLVEDLERQVDELTIRSPVTGIVGNLQVDQKAAVSRNQAVMAVVDLGAFEVEANVPESYADDLGIGMPAEIRIGATSAVAEVVAVSPEIVDNQVTTRLRFTAGTPPGLRQNQRLTTRILLESIENALVVERGQFLDSGGGRIAYVVDDDIARRREILVGARSLGEVEIASGLEAGDVIITTSLDAFGAAETVLITN
ncbi:MAG TPA: HlyD family efflux transporter periplasmic adaptor subunit [Gammaproteobacteria bacterium]|nr:HlyD family efflux transporter periplasmic adaptor subunit [Gammaproteobacteria bacterium]